MIERISTSMDNVGFALGHVRIVAESDDDGNWEIAITVPHHTPRPDGRLTTTTFWRPDDGVDISDGSTLQDVLDQLADIGTERATQ